MFFKQSKEAYRLGEKACSFSLSSAQIEVGYLVNGHGMRAKGINLVFSHYGPVEYGPDGTNSFIFAEPDAQRFVEFLDKVLAKELPAEFFFENDVSRRWFGGGSFLWVVTKFVDEWHGGGGFRGRFDTSFGYTITKASTHALRKCIVGFFSLTA